MTDQHPKSAAAQTSQLKPPPPAPATLERLARIDLVPPEATTLLRDTLRDPSAQDAQDSYEALRAASWKLLTGRIYGDAMREWLDVFRRAAALMKAADEKVLAEKTLTLAELALESARFGDAHRREAMARRGPVRKVLAALQHARGQAMREEILAATDLGQANLSRTLGNMVSVGLIERTEIGREVHLSLTQQGSEVLRQPPAGPNGAGGLSLYPSLDEDENADNAAAR
ncbi:helix-turn-helix transcriptional regulator [Phenylobacterium sp.]|uniref:helix-turn-helix transcriptional regulator n=1 Tax=Phenylobacterium sp. TaxID=1871053 RepID=UPI0035B1F4A7